MAKEQDKVLQILQLAIKMEQDGKKFYLRVSQESRHELGKKLMATLAAEEDIHRQQFEKIFDAIRNKQAWPKTDFQPDKGRTIKTIFAQANQETHSATTTEQDAVKVAIDMENQSYDLYNNQAKIAAGPTEKAFFEALAGEERGHQIALTDYLEFLDNPVDWFTMKEHHSLDGA
ncbi:MAG: ferritin family protein [Dehalococcoidales bacterium]|nr:ferritin family protein [Dehalococcoidales bacterium]